MPSAVACLAEVPLSVTWGLRPGYHGPTAFRSPSVRFQMSMMFLESSTGPRPCKGCRSVGGHFDLTFWNFTQEHQDGSLSRD